MLEKKARKHRCLVVFLRTVNGAESNNIFFVPLYLIPVNRLVLQRPVCVGMRIKQYERCVKVRWILMIIYVYYIIPNTAYGSVASAVLILRFLSSISTFLFARKTKGLGYPNDKKSSCVATPDVLAVQQAIRNDITRIFASVHTLAVLAILLITQNPLTKDSKLPII